MYAHALFFDTAPAEPVIVKVIPRQLFEIPIQAAIGGKVLARRTLSAMRADVTAGLYGGVYAPTRVQQHFLTGRTQGTTSAR